jgi:hypothetical protein
LDIPLPTSPYDRTFVLKDEKGDPVSGVAYKLVDSTGRVYCGTTDALGKTIKASAFTAGEIRCYFGDDIEN